MRLNKAQWCWLLYDPGNAAFALLVRAVFAPLFFMAGIKGIWSESMASANWGMLCSGAGVFAGACSLYFGALADAYAGRKLSLLISTAIGVAATLLLAVVGDYRLIMIVYFIALAAYMVSNSFYDSLLISVAKPEEFSWLSSFAYGFGYLGGLIPFLGILGGAFFIKESVTVARISFVVAAVWWAVFSLPLLLEVIENTAGKQHVMWYDGFRELMLTLREVWQDSNVRIFLIAYFLYIDGVSTILLMATPISVEIGMSEKMLMATILGLQVIGFPATVWAGNLARRFGARKIVYVELLLYIITALLIGVLSLLTDHYSKVAVFLTAALLIALSQGGIQALSRSLFSSLIPPEKAAEYFGVYNIFGKFTTILGPVLIYIVSHICQRSEYGIVLLIVPFTAGGILLSRVKFKKQTYRG
ncbi:MAG: MFS transporter [Lentisphaerae bacterium]|nr:MFS transporter [Lentisphaerota bacterium]